MKIKIKLLGKSWIMVFFFTGNLLLLAQQAPGIEWQKTLGGTQNDGARSVQNTFDDGVIVAGYTRSTDGEVTENHGGADFWVVKLDRNGSLEWEKTFGGSKDDMAKFVQPTSDGGYTIVGYTRSNDGQVTKNHGGADIWVVKLDRNGNLEWEKTYGGSKDDIATHVAPTFGSGLIITGYTFSRDGDVAKNQGKSDFWILKLESDGKMEWEKTYGGSGYDEASFVKQTSYGQYIVTGSTNSNNGDVTGNHGKDDFWVLQLNGSGDKIWQKTFGGSQDDRATALWETFDEGYVICGNTESRDGDVTYNHGMRDFWVVKLDDEGNLEWQKTYGGSYSDEANGIQQLPGERYIVTGTTMSNDGDVHGNHGNWDFWTVQLDNKGKIEWEATYGGTGYDDANHIEQVVTGGYVIAGVTFSNDGDVTGNHGKSDFWVVKLKSDINLVWENTFGGLENEQAKSVSATLDGGSITAGYTESNDGEVTGNHGKTDFWITKQGEEGNLEWQKALGGTQDDQANAIELVGTGSVAVGYTESNDGDVSGNHGKADFWVVKQDAKGNLEWQKTFGGTDVDKAYSVEHTSDGGYIVVGLTFSNDDDVTRNQGKSDCWAVKLNSKGNLVWQKTFGGTNFDYAVSVRETTEGGYVVVGYTYSDDGDVTKNRGDADVWVVMLTKAGTIAWQQTYGGSSNDFGSAIYETGDGGFVVIGTTMSNSGDVSGNHGYSDVWMLKISGTGNLEWQKCFGGTDYDYGRDVLQTREGNYIFVGESRSNDGDIIGNHGDWDSWVVKTSNNGSLLWQRALGGTRVDESKSIFKNLKGEYLVSGFTSSTDGDVTGNHGKEDFWVIKLKSEVNLTKNESSGGSGVPNAIYARPDFYGGNTATCVVTPNNKDTRWNYGLDYFRNGSDKIEKMDDLESLQFSVYPNPFQDVLYSKDACRIENLSIRNLLGEVIKEVNGINKKEYILDTDDVPKGIYILMVTTGNKRHIQKIIKN